MKISFTKVFDYIRSNMWTLLTIVITIVMLVMIARNAFHAVSIYFEIGVLEREKEYYQGLVERDSSLLKRLENDYELEKYAREKFYMHSDKEDIYIIK